MAQFGSYTNSSSPKMKWYANLSYTRISNSVVRVTVTVTGEITNHASSSWIGTGNAITVYAVVNGVSKNSVIKASSASWYGNTNNPRSCSFSFDVASSAAGTSIPVSYYVSASGYAAPAAVPTQSTSFTTPAMLYTASKPTLSASTLEMGKTLTINTNRGSTALTHTIQCIFAGVVVKTITGVTDSTTWTPEVTLAQKIPNADNGIATIRCTTYAGSTQIESAVDATAKLIVPASVIPTISGVALQRIDGTVPVAWGVYVQGKSAVKLTVTAAGAQGSTIKSYKITGGGYTGTANPYQTGLLNTAGDITFEVVVTDSRGRPSAAYPVTINVISYAPPKISAVLTKRCDSTGADNDEGTYALCHGTCTTYPVAGKNVITRKLYYRQYGTDAWTEAGTWTSEEAVIIGAGLLSPDRTYDIKYEVADSFTTANPVYRVDLLSSAHYLVDMYEDSDGNQYFAVGKAAEKPNVNEFAKPIEAPSAEFAGRTTSKSVQVQGDAGGGVLFPSPLDANRYWWFFNYIVNGTDYSKMAFRSVNKIGDNSYYRDYVLTGLEPDDAVYQSCLILTEKNTADYIVDKGSSGIWTYEKYNSGLVYLHGKLSKTVNINSAWGNVFISSGQYFDATFPFTLTQAISESISCEAVGWSAGLVNNGIKQLSTTTATSVQCWRGTAGTNVPVTVYWEVVGKWK